MISNYSDKHDQYHKQIFNKTALFLTLCLNTNFFWKIDSLAEKLKIDYILIPIFMGPTYAKGLLSSGSWFLLISQNEHLCQIWRFYLWCKCFDHNSPELLSISFPVVIILFLISKNIHTLLLLRVNKQISSHIWVTSATFEQL